MSYQRFSVEFKKSAVEKLLNRGVRSVGEIIEELGVSSPTLYQWKSDFGKVGGMNKSSRPQDRSAEEKLKLLNEYFAAPGEKRGEILRRLGIHKEHVEGWQSQVLKALKYSAIGKHVERSERAEDRRRIKELEKDLHRKDRALAETTALLVLKKKADLIWGTEESE
jgi:transposase-like protein